MVSVSVSENINLCRDSKSLHWIYYQNVKPALFVTFITITFSWSLWWERGDYQNNRSQHVPGFFNNTPISVSYYLSSHNSRVRFTITLLLSSDRLLSSYLFVAYSKHCDTKKGHLYTDSPFSYLPFTPSISAYMVPLFPVLSFPCVGWKAFGIASTHLVRSSLTRVNKESAADISQSQAAGPVTWYTDWVLVYQR